MTLQNFKARRLVLVVIMLLAAGCISVSKRGSGADAFKSFVRCETTPEDIAILGELRTKATPIEKRDGVWIYAYRGKILGIDTDKIILGVCSEAGGGDCGWGAFIAFQLNQSLEAAKMALLSMVVQSNETWLFLKYALRKTINQYFIVQLCRWWYKSTV